MKGRVGCVVFGLYTPFNGNSNNVFLWYEVYLFWESKVQVYLIQIALRLAVRAYFSILSSSLTLYYL